MDKLTYSILRDAVAGEYAAIRRVTRLLPAAEGEKIFPATYEGGEYATETRVVLTDSGTTSKENSVLIDSVQSQANRLESALLEAYRDGDVRFPMLATDFGGDIGWITALEAPHRIADAIFRDSNLGDAPFRQSDVGIKLDSAKAAYATPIFELCPTALIFGFWDSTGARGGLGAKVQRAVVSEIVGYEAVPGVRTSSRIDPLAIEMVDIYEKEGGGWTADPTAAVQKDGRPVKYGKEGKPSEINHGNITPSFRSKDKTNLPGGFTIAYAQQTTVLSLAALRKLRFPVPAGPSGDTAARTVLAALALIAICRLDREGYDLRSRCLLDGKPGTFEFVGRGERCPFELDYETATAIFNEAVAKACVAGLPWPTDPVVLTPSPELLKLVEKSRAKSAVATA